MKLTYIKQPGEPNGDAGDKYTGLDRFGRVIDQRWPQGSSELERVAYGFTAASNRQWRQEQVTTGQDEYYNYDGLYQVADSNRGTLNSTKTGIDGTPAWTEDFAYDPIGNWTNYLTKVSGVTNLDQSRTQNQANQTTTLAGSSATVAHDPAGNMVKVPQVGDWSSAYGLKYDAWNRLVSVKDGSTTVAEYSYDGLNRRTKKTIAGTTRRYYYSDQWQIVDERLDAATTPDRQFVWGMRYLDDLVLRDRDVDGDGSLDERLYVLSDYFNPTAIADDGGVVLERYGYDAFGLSRVMDADFEPKSSSDYDWETRYGAYRWDGETGFYQVRYRYLHPTLGRWLSRDPIGESGAINLYGYVSNACINRTDKLGLYQMDIHFYATYVIAKANGLPEADAFDLAYYAQYPDQNKTFDAIPAGFRRIIGRLFGRKPQDEEFDQDLQTILHSLHGGGPEAVAKWQCCIQCMVAEETVPWRRGVLIHTLGDAYAHVKYSGKDKGCAFIGPKGHLWKGTTPDIPWLRPDGNAVLSDYLSALNQSLGGKADVYGIAARFTERPSQALREQTSQRMGKNVVYNPEAAGHLQARNFAKEYGYSNSFDPTSGKLLGDDPTKQAMNQLVKDIKTNCGHTIGQ